MHVTPVCTHFCLRMLVYLMIYDSGYASIEHRLLSWYPSQRNHAPGCDDGLCGVLQVPGSAADRERPAIRTPPVHPQGPAPSQSTRPMAPMPSQWLQRAPSPQSIGVGLFQVIGATETHARCERSRRRKVGPPPRKLGSFRWEGSERSAMRLPRQSL